MSDTLTSKDFELLTSGHRSKRKTRKKLKPKKFDSDRSNGNGEGKGKKHHKKHGTKKRKTKKRPKKHKSLRNEDKDELNSSGTKSAQGAGGFLTLEELEQEVMRTRDLLSAFYQKHDPKKDDEDILAILLQFFVDCGGDALNQKLMEKYDEDLNTFNRSSAFKKLASVDVASNLRSSMTMAVRKSVNDSLKDSGMGFMADESYMKPDQKVETSFDTSKANQNVDSKSEYTRMSQRVRVSSAKFKKKRKKKPISMVDQFIKDMEKQTLALEEELAAEFFTNPPPNKKGSVSEKSLNEAIGVNRRDPNRILDNDDSGPIETYDLVEAFYSEMEPSKLVGDLGNIDKIVRYANRQGQNVINQRLRLKYNLDLTSFRHKAKRRRNARYWIERFYERHDPGKLEEKYRVERLRLVEFTLTNGVEKVNENMKQKYNAIVFPL